MHIIKKLNKNKVSLIEEALVSVIIFALSYVRVCRFVYWFKILYFAFLLNLDNRSWQQYGTVKKSWKSHFKCELDSRNSFREPSPKIKGEERLTSRQKSTFGESKK